MAMEPRFWRRVLAQRIKAAIEDFPDTAEPRVRTLTFVPSFFPNKAYVILQLKAPVGVHTSEENRTVRRHMLEIACGVTKNKFADITTIVGISFDSPKYTTENSEDFILLDCNDWNDQKIQYYDSANKLLRFYETGSARKRRMRTRNFPLASEMRTNLQKRQPVGRNQLCPCGSSLKYKNCCMRSLE